MSSSDKPKPPSDARPTSWLDVPSPVQPDGKVTLRSTAPAPIPPSEDIELDDEDREWVERTVAEGWDEVLAKLRELKKR